jgi:hypothetical protein
MALIDCAMCGKRAERYSTYRRCRECALARRKELHADVYSKRVTAANRERYKADHQYREALLKAGRHYRDRSRPKTPRYRERRPGDLVYFVQDTASGYVKIGFTSKPIEQRLRLLQTGNPNPLAILALAPGAPVEEHRLHRRFDSDRYRREWFKPSPALLDYIDGVKATGALN